MAHVLQSRRPCLPHPAFSVFPKGRRGLEKGAADGTRLWTVVSVNAGGCPVCVPTGDTAAQSSRLPGRTVRFPGARCEKSPAVRPAPAAPGQPEVDASLLGGSVATHRKDTLRRGLSSAPPPGLRAQTAAHRQRGKRPIAPSFAEMREVICQERREEGQTPALYFS